MNGPTSIILKVSFSRQQMALLFRQVKKQNFCQEKKQNFFVWRKSKTFFCLVPKQNFFCLVWKQTFLSGLKTKLTFRLHQNVTFACTKMILSHAPKCYFLHGLRANHIFCLVLVWTSRKPYFWSGVGLVFCIDFAWTSLDFAQTIFFVWCWSGVCGCFRAWSGVLGRIGHSGRLV